MRRIVFVCLPVVAALAYFCLVQNAPAADDPAPSSDQKFVHDASAINLAEESLGKMAKEHATNDALKKFAADLIKDHGKLEKELEDLAQRKGLRVANQVERKAQEISERLGNMKGADFDREFTKNLIAGHELAIKKFEKEAKNGQDPDLKKWAQKSLKGLKEHLRMAKDTEKQLHH